MKDTDQNFEDLKRLLKLKQYEVPPPGYFNNFSSEVIARIRAGEAGGHQTAMEKIQSGSPWLVKFIGLFEFRPGLVGSFATGLCLLLLLGVVFTEHSDNSATDLLTLSAPGAQPVSGSITPLSGVSAAPPLLAASPTAGIVASTNPVTSLQPTATLFGQSDSESLFQTASFAPIH